MLQSLLEDRFKLVVRHSTKNVLVYELKLVNAGNKRSPGLHELEPGTCPPGPRPPGNPGAAPCGGFLSVRNHLSGHRVTISALTSPLSTILQRPVLDKTGLSGEFDLELYWMADENLSARGDSVSAPPDVSPSSLFEAIKEQLGLKLESARGPIDILVVEGAEKPDEN